MRYFGRVQGVGFRYTCASIAKRYPVSGYVKNLRDGSVELLVSGNPKTIADFLAEIAETFAENISESTMDEIALPEPLKGFVIRH